ncbi:peptidoglycan DD-metalloendopeptidase family protein [Tahibacter soli]|uniref:Peptidoglycan DD-metalloendopeptidase family protein n=1 Tax=Tahibacter soli TaxID=2983605 RepID=A0A9X3YLN0_9GAMM|nr:peptidoglycan DD-metalloendopeptidase family protein [Tahibacter soli]MDC8013879.1 peptidoglycan DD-metalloendopeptidase family protein [Tahibacter soli]
MRIATTLLILATTTAATAAPPDGGGPWRHAPGDDLTAEHRARIDAELARNVEALTREGKLAPAMLAPRQANLQWPLRAVPAYRGFGYHGISNFVDLNTGFPNQVLDFNCGGRSYDLSDGYNHAGIDFFLWPFSWRMMDQQMVDIVAAAPGTIIGKQDGFNDRSCPNNYSADWNAVYVRHGDGSVAWYGHMKTGSLTSKAIGATVTAGEFLGKVGSSGFSTGPHLHFENHTAVSNYQIVEPYAGACRAGATLWAQQPAYYDSAINELATHSAAPNFPSPNCPNPVAETPNFADAVQPGQQVIFAAYYRDQRAGQVTNFAIVRPDGTTFQSWNFDMAQATSDPYYDSSYWYWTYTLPAGAPAGVWRFRATFQSRTYEHRFTVGDVVFADGFEQ